MNLSALKLLVQQIVKQATALKDKHTAEKAAPVNYACIFSQSETEYSELLNIAKQLGKVVQETPSGFLFVIPPLETVAGKLQLLKIRLPDVSRPERGDADFTVSDYLQFKATNLARPGFKLIPKEGWEMIELMDSAFNVRVYFSHPPLDKQLGLT